MNSPKFKKHKDPGKYAGALMIKLYNQARARGHTSFRVELKNASFATAASMLYFRLCFVTPEHSYQQIRSGTSLARHWPTSDSGTCTSDPPSPPLLHPTSTGVGATIAQRHGLRWV